MLFIQGFQSDMKRIVLAAGVIVISTGIARGEDAAKAYMQRSVGQWHSTATEGAERAFGVMIGRWSSDKTAVLGQERIFGPELNETWYGRSIKSQGDEPGMMKLTYAAGDGTHF